MRVPDGRLQVLQQGLTARPRAQVRCDKVGRVVNITLTSPDHLLSQYADLQALQHGGGDRLSFVNDIDPDNPADWEAVTKFQKHWPDWHYQTPQLHLSQLPSSDNFLQLGRDSLRGLHLDNTRCRPRLASPGAAAAPCRASA